MQNISQPSDIELRSDEVQEILTRPPHALVRYGISLICGVLAVLFTGSFFFRYPDIVQGEVLITTENPPVWLVAHSTGKIKELLCADKQEVAQGDLLAVIENPASTSHIQTVHRLLAEVQLADSVFHIPEALLEQPYELGGVQPAFSAFTSAAADYHSFRSLNLIYHDKNALQIQIADRSAYLSNLRKQLSIKRKELEIARSAYERERKLYDKGVISKSDMEIAEQAYLAQQQSVQQLQTSLSLENVESAQMRENIQKLSIQYEQEKNRLFTALESACRELLAAIENCQQSYFLTSPQNGTVTFNAFWKQNQFINTGDKVFAVISRQPGAFVGKIKLPASGSGKTQAGQAVHIKLAGFPYMEYGVIRGTIRNISLVPNDDFYIAEVNLTNGLRSSINKEITFTGELAGIAEIITENRSLMERIVAPLKYVTKRYL